MLQSSLIEKTLHVSLLLFFLALFYPIGAQETAPVNEELQRWIDRNKLLAEQEKAAKSEAAIATAQKDKLAAQFPKPTSAPLAGDTKVDASVKIESEIMAYQALTRNSAAIVKDIKSNNLTVKTLAILNQPMIQNLQLYAAIDSQLNLLVNEYNSAMIFPSRAQVAKLEQPIQKVVVTSSADGTKMLTMEKSAVTTTTSLIPLALPAITGMIGGFVDLLSFFRTDTSVTGNSYTVKESAFVAEMSRAVKDGYSDAQFYYPGEFTPKPNGLEKYEILENINLLNSMRLRSDFLVSLIEELEKNIKDLETKAGALKARQNQITLENFKAEDEVGALEKINKKYPNAANYEKLELKRLAAKTLLRESLLIPSQLKQLEAALTENKGKLKEAYALIKYVYEPGITDDLILLQQKQNIARLKSVNAQFATFYNALLKPETTATNPLSALMLAETMRTVLCGAAPNNAAAPSGSDEIGMIAAAKLKNKKPDCTNSYILALGVVNAGGSNMTKKNLITNVFTGADIRHSGGVVTEYRLYNLDGKLVTGKTFTTYEPYKKANAIKD